MKSEEYIVVNKSNQEMTIVFTGINKGLLSSIKGVDAPDREVFCKNNKWQVQNFGGQRVIFQSEIQKGIKAALLKWKPKPKNNIDLIMEKMGY